MKRELTKFQIACEERLATAVEKAGQRVVNRRLDGNTQTYVTGEIEGLGVKFWIYSDMADFDAPGGGRVFERPDYDSPDDLAEDFIEALVAATRS